MDALKKLSSMYRVVVSTGGGAVIRPINWCVPFIPSEVKTNKTQVSVELSW